jgi:catechol 2,3-dioxygenase-like lactoylglutathione lyase family enzyme
LLFYNVKKHKMRLNQITVPVSDIPAAIAFYTVLGLRLIVKSPHYARFELPQGESTFSIHQTADLPQGEKINGITVYFEIENLDEYVADLQTKGLVFAELPNDKIWLWREAHLYDLDGNHLILFWADENRKNPPWRV